MWGGFRGWFERKFQRLGLRTVFKAGTIQDRPGGAGLRGALREEAQLWARVYGEGGE